MGSIALVKLKRTDSTGTDREQCAFLACTVSYDRHSAESSKQSGAHSHTHSQWDACGIEMPSAESLCLL